LPTAIGRVVSILAPIAVGLLAARTSLAFAYQVSVPPSIFATIAFAEPARGIARECRA
jgi:hypothetical protein